MAERYWMLVMQRTKTGVTHALHRYCWACDQAVCGARCPIEKFPYFGPVTCKRCIAALDRVKAAQNKEKADGE